MDFIIQGLFGAVIVEVGFCGKLGGRVLVWGAFCGVVLDFDMLAVLVGEWEVLVHYCGVSHLWIVQSLFVPVLGYLVWCFWGRREGVWWQWAYLSWWVLVMYLVFDVCTVYGM